MMYHLMAIVLAVVLDSFIGDPPSWPHPVKGFGKMISYFDRRWNHGNHLKLKGLCMVIILIGIVFSLVMGLVTLAYELHPLVGILVEAILIATTIAQKSLKEAAREVGDPLQKGDIEQAREKLSYIVGRDTTPLTEEEVVRGTVETVAENTSDGVTAPLFWAAIGGAPFAFIYRLINTCDSMVGYLDATHRHFGWASARLDDVVNWLPARLTGLVMMVSYRPKQKTRKQAWYLLLCDAKKHPSPNSGWTEAAIAALLGIQLGGVNYYHGQPSYRMEMGIPVNRLQRKYINETITIMNRTVVLFLTIIMLGGIIVELTFTWIQSSLSL